MERRILGRGNPTKFEKYYQETFSHEKEESRLELVTLSHICKSNGLVDLSRPDAIKLKKQKKKKNHFAIVH
jgi:hypothetical protein